MHVATQEGSCPIKVWTDHVEASALAQLKNLARLRFIDANGVACMPDVHAGIGSTVGTVIATDKAILPAAVGVNIGCGMNAVRLPLKASDLPESLNAIRDRIERDVPLGAGGGHPPGRLPCLPGVLDDAPEWLPAALKYGDRDKFMAKAAPQLGTLGSGNHLEPIPVGRRPAR